MKEFVCRMLKRMFRDTQSSDDLAFFRKITLFHGLHDRQLRRVLQAMQKRQYYEGETIFEEGRAGQSVFVIRSGGVELSRRASHDKAKILARPGPGQIFGEMALLDRQPRTATARVAEDGEIYLLDATALESLMRRYPDIGVDIMKNIAIVLSALLRKANEELDKGN
ncbi:MAG: cyclic nucleotide-binding domain-containing protein [Verrucomicrobiia bacterium]